MAVLRLSDRLVALGARNLIGRAPHCTLPVDDRQVSSEHASVRWSDGAWWVRDLGSRNGTTLDDTPVLPGKARALAVGQRLRFGTDLVATVIDVGPPGPAARHADGRITTMADGLLVLPGADNPRVLVYEAADGDWAVEVDGDPRPATDGEQVAVEADVWQIILPIAPREDEVPTTWDASAHPHLETITLRFRPSADEEQVDITMEWPGGALPLSARTHQFVMLELARARLADLAAGVADAEAGWRYADELQRALRLEPATLNLYLFRAREQLAQAGVDGAARLFERRRLSGQVRIGVSQLVVVTS